jgi:hypothetical protein
MEGREAARRLEAAEVLPEVEDLCRRYLLEVRDPRAVETITAPHLDDVRASVERFAVAVDDATRAQARAAGLAMPERAEAADPLRAAFDQLYRTEADFVTPGDLYLADSLFTVGRLSAV